MKVKKISESYVKRLWIEIGEGSDIPESLCGLNFNNLVSISKMVNEYLLSALQTLPISYQVRIKESLRYAINFWDEHQLERVYDGGLPIIALPTEFSCREFYIHIWTYLFPNESYIIEDKSVYLDIGPLSAV